jgi:glycosyltransferase involved in cell wall biosynthesis
MFVLTPPFDPNAGGVQMTTYKLSKWLSEAGHVVGVFSFAAEGHVNAEFFDIFSSVDYGGSSSDANLVALNRALHQFQPDVVINQMPYEHRIGYTLRKFNPPLLLGCLRNTLFSVKNNLDRYASEVLPKSVRRFFQNPLGRASLLSYHRRRHRRDLEKILGTYDYFVMFAPQNLDELEFFVPRYERSKIKLIPNSVPFVLDRVPKKEKRMLWLGRLDNHQKRADLILPLWEKVQASLPDWEFDIVGDGPALDNLKHEISARSISGVNLIGRQKPDEYFRRSAIYIMTSSFEGFPNTLVEAQSLGAIPVLFNSFPVAEFIVTQGVDGFLVEPFDLDKMASCIVEIACSEHRSDISCGALKSARRFEIDTVGRIWQQLFDDCLRNNQMRNRGMDA